MVLALAGTPGRTEIIDPERHAFAVRNAEASIAALTERHPDWRRYEQQMLRIGNKLGPQRGVGPVEYLQLLYGLAVVMESSPKKLEDVIAEARK